MKRLLKIIGVVLFTIANLTLNAQIEEAEPDVSLIEPLPDGLYEDLDDFVSGNPTSTKRIEMRDLDKPKQKLRDDLCTQCYFQYTRSDKRVKDAFALV